MEVWTKISAIAAMASAASTFLASIVALIAMKSWKNQEKQKAYQKYKMSLEVFRLELTMLPDDFSSLDNRQSFSSTDGFRNDAIKSFAKCSEAWIGYSVYNPSPTEVKSWQDLFLSSNSYLYHSARKKHVVNCIEKSLKLNSESFWEKVKREICY